MALKAEWLTQHDLCDYGTSVRLYCLPGAIVTTNPQLIKPNSAFCFTVNIFFSPLFSHRQKAITPPWSIIALLKYRHVQFSCAAKLVETGLRPLNDSISLHFVLFPALFVFITVRWLVNEEHNARSAIILLLIYLCLKAIFHLLIKHNGEPKMIHRAGDVMLLAIWDGSA